MPACALTAPLSHDPIEISDLSALDQFPVRSSSYRTCSRSAIFQLIGADSSAA